MTRTVIRQCRAACAGIFLSASVGCLTMAACSQKPESDAGKKVLSVQEGSIESWMLYDGVLQPRRVERIASPLPGAATLIELAPEGARVAAGDVIARFDADAAENELTRAEMEWATANADLQMLEQATLPLEREELDRQLAETRAALAAEREFAATCREMVQQQVVTEGEAAEQDAKVETAEKRVQQSERKRALTLEHIHPQRIARARAAELAARKQRDAAALHVEHTLLRAPCGGPVSLMPVYLNGEQRTVHVGDTIFRNQPFMSIAALDAWTVDVLVSEQDIGRVNEGAEVRITLTPWPDQVWTGSVESVSSMPESAPARPSAIRLFRAHLRLDTQDARFRTGLTARVRILEGRHPRSVLLPRTALDFRNGMPGCFKRDPTAHHAAWQPVRIGLTEPRMVEILEGLKPGDTVEMP